MNRSAVVGVGLVVLASAGLWALLNYSSMISPRGAVTNQPVGSNTNRHTIVYRVSGTTDEGSLTYVNESGGTEQRAQTRIPWEAVQRARSGQHLYLSAQNQRDSGSIRCQIIVDGKVFKESESRGAYVIASCSGRP